MKTWSIDSSLRLNPVPTLPEDAGVLECPEQLIDTIMLRNLSLMTTELLGRSSKFLFHSTDYWGAFDVACVLDDGTLACFENKANSFDRKGFQKFLDDIESVNANSREYVSHRFEHVTENHHEYVATAMRMFSGFFLRIRCDTVKMTRDLAAEAAAVLGLSRSEFESNFESGNDWLVASKHKPTLSEYVSHDLASFDANPILPILMITANCKDRVSSWIADTPNIPSNALLATYQFHSDNGSYPTHLVTEKPVPITRMGS